jgi:hypothetical protein
MGRADRAERAIEAAAAIRTGRLARAEGLVLGEIGPGVPKRRAAALLGISVTALERWIRHGRLPVVRRPGGREEIDARALLDVFTEVRRLRGEEGASGRVVGRALARLETRGLPRRRLRPNTSAGELRRAYLESTPAERLREAAELSLGVTTLARYGARARARQAND